MEFFLKIVLPFFGAMHIGLAGIFRKAGKPAWAAFVPVYNLFIWLELIGRPKWWVVYYLIPFLNLVMGIGLILDLIRSFGKQAFVDHFLAVVFPFLYFPYLGLVSKDQYVGKWVDMMHNQPAKTKTRDWLDAILFAGVAALVIRTFLIEAFMIPTTSMEGSLMAGDFLFVSKFHYGVRMPQAPLSVPFVHNTLPFTTDKRSFLEWVQLPYARFPGFMDVQRNDIVVFNYPDDDVHPDVPELGKIKITSLKQNYIKRCVAVGGDTLSIRNQELFINGKPAWKAENLQVAYEAAGFSEAVLRKEGFRTNPNDMNRNAVTNDGLHWEIMMSESKAAQLAKYPNVALRRSIIPDTGRLHRFHMERQSLQDSKGWVYPKEPTMYQWSIDNFGPLYVPKKGVTVKLDRKNLPFYRKAIEVYEKNDFKVEGDKYFLNGQPVDSYTFKMNYYFMMGDNRCGSLDSRYWGFVPEDHIIGRPWFVLLSVENGIRWDRILRPISKWEP